MQAFSTHGPNGLSSNPLQETTNPSTANMQSSFLADDSLSPTFRQLADNTYKNFSFTETHSNTSIRNSALDDIHATDIAISTPSEALTPSNIKVESDSSSFQGLCTETDERRASNVSATSASVLTPLPETKIPPSTITTPLKSPAHLNYRPRSSIPPNLPWATYANQCVTAAYASRLNPYALHKEEQTFLEDHLGHLQVTAYLNIRNGILRLWTRNPLISVSKEEAIGCIKDIRWVDLAAFSYEWLVRRGYINFGCVEAAPSLTTPKRGRKKESPQTIVVVGAGMAGLGCARQLESLLNHYARTIQPTPRIVVLEGRQRLGGRIHSHPLSAGKCETFLDGVMPTAEMGAHIIVGFDHGNPLDTIIRGQLALPYHSLHDLSTLYDIDGKAVEVTQDFMAQGLYNEILERSCQYRHKVEIRAPAEGQRQMIDAGKDVLTEDGVTIRQYAEGVVPEVINHRKSNAARKGFSHKPTEKGSSTEAELPTKAAPAQGPAAQAAKTMGWKLKPGVEATDNLQLDAIAKLENQNLGTVMDECIKQYAQFVDLTPKDMRLINWHYANLEYANNANVKKLSLTSWDQDIGNEFQGEHSQIIGGYQQLPRALWRAYIQFPGARHSARGSCW